MKRNKILILFASLIVAVALFSACTEDTADVRLGFRAPVVKAERCVGCGQCENRCHAVLVEQRGGLDRAAIVVEQVDGHVDRMRTGSYRALREAEEAEREARRQELLRKAREQLGGDFY